jgi:hypothetical protein
MSAIRVTLSGERVFGRDAVTGPAAPPGEARDSPAAHNPDREADGPMAMSIRSLHVPRAVVVAAAILLAALWPISWATHAGDVTALLGVGRTGPSAGFVEPELGHGVAFASKGHDGQQFYVVARMPFDPKAGAGWLDNPAYRYRRILFPLAARGLDPRGGRSMAVAFAAVSLLGVALAALACTRFRGAPWWLPLVPAVTAGVIASLYLSLSDALAVGLVLTAFALATDRRWTLAIVAATLAALTRETAILAAVALAASPGLRPRQRALIAGVPALALGAWIAFVGVRLGASSTAGSAQQFAFPLTGWLHSTDTGAGIAIGVLGAVLIALGAWRAGSEPAVRAYLVLLLALDIVLATDVTGSWVNASRVIAAGIPLAVWMVFRRADEVVPVRA